MTNSEYYINRLQNELNKIYNKLPSRDQRSQRHIPFIHIRNEGKEIIALIEMLGIQEDEIKIHLEQNYVKIHKNKEIYREFSLLEKINPETSTFRHKNGMLKITMPKYESPN